MLKRSCKFFNTTGKCRFGKHCKFSHDIDIPQGQEIQQTVNHESVNQSVAEDLPGSISVSLNSKQTNDHGSLSFPRSEEGSRSFVPSSDDKDNNENEGLKESKEPSGRKICRFFAKNRYCHFGRRCRFEHVIVLPTTSTKQSETREDVLVKESPNGNTKQDDVQKNKVQDKAEVPADLVDITKKLEVSPSKETKGRICKFFKQGHCRFGNRCHFYHPLKANKKPQEETRKVTKSVSAELKETVPAKPDGVDDGFTPVVRSKPKIMHVYERQDLTDEKLKELKNTEVQQLKRRFPAGKIKIVNETGEHAVYVFTFLPSDPDWPFDVNSFDIQVAFGEDYPLKMFSVELPVDQDLPATVRRYIEVSLQEWVAKKEQDNIAKGIAELLFRPFLRWMDRNMETIVTEGLRQLRRELTAKAAGLQFIAASDLKKESQTSTDMESQATFDTDDSDIKDTRRPVAYRKGDYVEERYEAPQRQSSSSEEDEENEAEPSDDAVHQRPTVAENVERSGTELVFRNMQIWYCTTIVMEKIHVTVQCERCKNHTDFASPPNRVNLVPCGKCNNRQLVVFRPVLAHSYSSTFGYLDLEGCTGFDVVLQDCHFSMGCIMCSRDILVKKFSPGRVLDIFCRSCHNKMQFAADSVKLQVITPGEVDTSKFSGSIHQVAVKRIGRVMKDPAIQEGKPLPDTGACKHYKKSFRWLRFPCCGKCYPCDVCHDDKEDHEMKFANRMICGFCCKEQPYAGEKPCIGCSSALTKVHTSHWEGGKGCRNKISMSRSDDKKYTNLNKTVSKKSSQEKKPGVKNTKLRHS